MLMFLHETSARCCAIEILCCRCRNIARLRCHRDCTLFSYLLSVRVEKNRQQVLSNESTNVTACIMIGVKRKKPWQFFRERDRPGDTDKTGASHAFAIPWPKRPASNFSFFFVPLILLQAPTVHVGYQLYYRL